MFSVGGGNRAHNVSVNLVRAIELAHEVGAAVFGVVGARTARLRAGDVCIVFEAPPERRTPHVEGSRRSSGIFSSRTRRS